MKKKKINNYFIYLLRHKYYIFIELIKRRLFVQAIFHDWDKFLPGQILINTKFFKENILSEEDKLKYIEKLFEHRKRSKHHWEYWVSPIMNEYLTFEFYRAEITPKKYLTEMLCDWIAAGKTQNNIPIYDWWKENKRKIIMNFKSLTYLDNEINKLKGEN